MNLTPHLPIVTETAQHCRNLAEAYFNWAYETGHDTEWCWAIGQAYKKATETQEAKDAAQAGPWGR